jgi:hypothetical protein
MRNKKTKPPKSPCKLSWGCATIPVDKSKNSSKLLKAVLAKTSHPVKRIIKKKVKNSDASSLPFLSRVGFGQRDALYRHIFRQDDMATRDKALGARGTQSHGTVECDNWFDDRRIGSTMSNELVVELTEGLSHFILLLCAEIQNPAVNSLKISPLQSKPTGIVRYMKAGSRNNCGHLIKSDTEGPRPLNPGAVCPFGPNPLHLEEPIEMNTCKKCESQNVVVRNVEFGNHTKHTEVRCQDCKHIFYIRFDAKVGPAYPSSNLQKKAQLTFSSFYR